MQKTIRFAALTASAIAAAALLAPLSAGAANAAVTGYSATVQYIGGGSYINVRTGPSRGDSIAYTVQPGAGLSIECQTVGGALGFSSYAQNRTWDRLSDGKYVHDVLTTTPGGSRTDLPDGGYAAFSSGIPRCDTSGPAPVASRESRAAQWAQSQVGVVEDSGYCETFAEQAYGTIARYGSADADYSAQANAGRIHTDTNPPAGALVFYDVAPYGHVGVSLGNGQVVSTKSPVNGADRPVRQHSVLGLGLKYRGWSYAPDAWSGR